MRLYGPLTEDQAQFAVDALITAVAKHHTWAPNGNAKNVAVLRNELIAFLSKHAPLEHLASD